MSGLMAKLWFVFRCRLRGARVSFFCYIKNPAQIQLSAGVKIHGNSALDASSSGHIVLASKVTLNRSAYITASRGGVRIGPHSEINHFALINGAGGVEIGARVLIGPGVRIISYQHSYQDVERPIAEQDYIYRPIVIEDDVWIGANAVILAGVTLGRGSVVGAGAVVTKTFEPYSVLVGMPARLLRTRGA